MISLSISKKIQSNGSSATSNAQPNEQSKSTGTIVPLSELTQYCTQIVKDIRAGSAVSKEYKDLNSKIDTLTTQYEKLVNANRSTWGRTGKRKRLFVYNDIISVVMDIRKQLTAYIPQLQQYDTINYTFWHNGKRYVVDSLQPKWINKSSSKLVVSWTRVANDIEKMQRQGYSLALREAVEDHRNMFQQFLVNDGLDLSKAGVGGYIAEAYEEHLFQHHNDIWNLINTQTEDQLKTMLHYDANGALQVQSIIQHHINTLSTYSEDAKTAWAHYHNAHGTLWGTVGGDVFNRQVKDENTKLASLQQLQSQLQLFSRLLDNQISPDILGRELAIRLSEKLPSTEELAEQIVKEQLRQL